MVVVVAMALLLLGFLLFTLDDMQESLEREAAMQHDPGAMGVEPTLQQGLTWPQSIGGYGEHFSMADPTEDGTHNLRSRAHPSIIKDRAAAHSTIMKSWNDDDPWKDDFEEVMCEVALLAKHGAENHYKSMDDLVDLSSGSRDKRVLDLVGKEPKGYNRSIILAARCLVKLGKHLWNLKLVTC